MLVICPECGEYVSDSAEICPSCGATKSQRDLSMQKMQLLMDKAKKQREEAQPVMSKWNTYINGLGEKRYAYLSCSQCKHFTWQYLRGATLGGTADGHVVIMIETYCAACKETHSHSLGDIRNCISKYGLRRKGSKPRVNIAVVIICIFIGFTLYFIYYFIYTYCTSDFLKF